MKKMIQRFAGATTIMLLSVFPSQAATFTTEILDGSMKIGEITYRTNDEYNTSSNQVRREDLDLRSDFGGVEFAFSGYDAVTIAYRYFTSFLVTEDSFVASFRNQGNSRPTRIETALGSFSIVPSNPPQFFDFNYFLRTLCFSCNPENFYQFTIINVTRQGTFQAKTEGLGGGQPPAGTGDPQSTPEPSLILGFITLGGLMLGSRKREKA